MLAGQDSQYRRDTCSVKTDILRSSQPPSKHIQRPHNHPNPPRRRGRLKTRPKSVSTTRWTYQAIRKRRGHIGRIGCGGRFVYWPESAQERPQTAIREDEVTEYGRAATSQIGQPLQRSATSPDILRTTIHSFNKALDTFL